MVYLYLRRVMPIEYAEKGLTKIVLDDHKRLPFVERIKNNFSKEIWKSRFNYYIRYAFIKKDI